MRTVIDSFWDLIEDIKSQSGIMDPMRNISHPLNSVLHPLKSPMHPMKNVANPVNSIMNPLLGREKLRIIRDLINQYILDEMPLKKQSSDKLSRLASQVLNGYHPTRQEIKSLAASVLSQDETSGRRVG